MIKAVLWKEWKGYRRSFYIYLVIVILVSVALTQLISDSGTTARQFLFVSWAFFALVSGLEPYEERRKETVNFLRALSATSPFLFSAHYFSHLARLGVLIVVSLFIHAAHIGISHYHLSPLDILFHPNVIFAIFISLLAFTAAALASVSLIVFGGTIVGLVFLALILLSVIYFIYFLEPSRAFAARLPSFLPTESPALFLFSLLSAALVSVFLSLLMVSFGEIRNTRNKRWFATLAVTVALSLILVFETANLVSEEMSAIETMEFKEAIITGLKEYYPVMLVAAANGKEDYLIPNPTTFWLKKLVPTGQLSLSAMKKGRGFTWSGTLTYHSDKPVWGQEIRAVGLNRLSTRRVSPAKPSGCETLTRPYGSPDGDRIAYLKTGASRFGSPSSISVWITKWHAPPVSDSVILSENPGDMFEPIDWTPDGYDFMVRKRGPEGAEIWAVDWVAEGVRPFLDGFWNSEITGDDLPHAGEWLSLIRPEPDGARSLWLVNYRSGPAQRIAVSKEVPVRAWADSGTRFAYWTFDSGLFVYSIDDSLQLHLTCPGDSRITQMKWSLGGTALAVVAESADPNAGPSLLLIHADTCAATMLVESFTAQPPQWDWLNDTTIVYAQGRELWQVTTGGKRELIVSLGPAR